MINDRDLNKSIGKARDLWLDSLDLPEAKEAPFSPEFEKNTLRLLKRSRLKHSLSRMFTACIIVALMLSATLYTVLAQPEGKSTLGFTLNENGGCTISIDSDGKGPMRGNVGIEPGFLPEGYTLVYHSTISNKSIFLYGHKNNLPYSYMNLNITVTDLSNFETHQKIKHFKNESIDAEMINVRNCAGYYITNGSCKYVIWIEDNYFIQVHGYITREEIVKTAQNLTVYESKK